MKFTEIHAFIGFAILFLALVIWHESYWWRIRFWKKATGIVIDIEGVADDAKPVIEYNEGGITHTFTSLYGGSGCPDINSKVIILYDPITYRAEHYTLANRWVFTLVPLAIVIMLIIAIFFR